MVSVARKASMPTGRKSTATQFLPVIKIVTRKRTNWEMRVHLMELMVAKLESVLFGEK